MIFVDTSAWYAIEVEDDINHEMARKFLSEIASCQHCVLITIDYVLDETLTLLRSKRNLASACEFINKIKESKSVQVFWVDEGSFGKALDILQKSDRKSWSFTDCTSFALIRELEFCSDCIIFCPSAYSAKAKIVEATRYKT